VLTHCIPLLQGKTNGPSKPPLTISTKTSSNSHQSITESPASSATGTPSIPNPSNLNNLALSSSSTAANLQTFSNLNSSSSSVPSTFNAHLNPQQQAQLISYSDAAAPQTSADLTSRPTSAGSYTTL